jgi:hypothetical protein
MIVQVAAIVVLMAFGGWGLWQASQTPIGPAFLLDLVPVFLVLVFVPLIGYRAYALWRAYYLLERDGIYLRWGLREEIIPMDTITWVRSSDEIESDLPRPWFRWPGAVLGIRRLPDAEQVEYLAARSNNFILIATEGNFYAITPSNPEEFIRSYQRFAELGSLTPLTAHSVYPANLLRRLWASSAARYLLLAGLAIAILLLILVSLVVPTTLTVSLGFNPDGTPSEPVSSVFLLLLPLLNGIYYLTISLFGMYLFRTEEGQTLAYLLWGSGSFTGLLFITAVVFILRAS